MALLNAGAAQATSPHLIVQPKGTMTVAAAGQSAPAWGTTPISIGSSFPGIMLTECLNNPSFKVLMLGADPIMVARFSTELMAHDPDYVDIPALFKCMAEKTYPGVLVMMASAFGIDFMAKWAVPYMSPLTLLAYNELLTFVEVYPQSYFWVRQGHTLPISQMGDLYGYDVYLDAYLSQQNVTYAEIQTAKNQAANTTALYLRSTLHRGEKEAPIIILAAAVGIVVGVFAIADSPTAQRLGTLLVDAALATPQELVDLIIDPDLDWGVDWHGSWDMSLFCLGYGDGC
jgi:hypothetical protein